MSTISSQCLPDSPLLWIKVVGTVADVLQETQGEIMISSQDKAGGGARRKLDGLPLQVSNGLPVVKLTTRERPAAQDRRQGQGMARHQVFSFEAGKRDSGMKDVQRGAQGRRATAPMPWGKQRQCHPAPAQRNHQASRTSLAPAAIAPWKKQGHFSRLSACLPQPFFPRRKENIRPSSPASGLRRTARKNPSPGVR